MWHRFSEALVPSDAAVRRRRWELIGWSFLLAIAYYPLPFGFFGWFCLARPLAIISGLNGRAAFRAAYLFGFFFSLFSLWWIGKVTPPGMLSTVFIIGFYYACALWLFNKLYRMKPLLGFIGAPVLWAGLEYFRTLSEFAFPWSDLGYTQSYYLYVMQIVSVISTHGLSFLMVAANVLVLLVFRKQLSPERRITSFFASVTIVSLLVAYGWIVVPRYPVPGNYPVAILQGSMPVEVKWQAGNEYKSLQLYDSLARTVSDSVNLFVWPETSAPCYLSHDQECRRAAAEIARASGAPHLIGALGAARREGEQRYFNSCYQFNADGSMDARYDKMKLVPFTEQVPYQQQLPFLRKEFLTQYLTFIETYEIQWWSDFFPGDSRQLFNLGDVQYGVLICFESTFPEFVRGMIQDGAQFVVGITNDTWFEGTPGLHMHARILIARAIENRCWMVRAANSGYSYVVDDYGRVRADLSLNEEAALVHKIELLQERSIFTRRGDVVGLASFLIVMALATIFLIQWVIKRFSR